MELLLSLALLVFGPIASASDQLQIARPLVINGCTASPEGTWRHCCEEHDIMYWIGGTFEDRKAADIQLRECMYLSGGEDYADLYYSTVRSFGMHAWSKAWPARSVESLTFEERELIDSEFKVYLGIGMPLDFEFVLRESIVFEPLNTEKLKLLRNYLNAYRKRDSYQEFLIRYQIETKRLPLTVGFHD